MKSTKSNFSIRKREWKWKMTNDNTNIIVIVIYYFTYLDSCTPLFVFSTNVLTCKVSWLKL